MGNEVVEALVNGGKATAGPPIGPALGPLGVNIGEVISQINSKTKDFVGMSVPVKIIVNTDDKSFKITVGTPPTSQLLIKEAKIKKGSSNPKTDFVADLKIEQVIKVSKMKEDALLGKENYHRVREVLGTCQSMGLMVEGKTAAETLVDVKNGAFKNKIDSGKTELTAEEIKEQAAEQVKMQEELKERRDEFLASAKEILAQNGSMSNKELRTTMTEAGIPMEIVNEIAPEEEKKAEGEEGKPAEEKKE
ncbi:50S ribosomal protein L11 [archaeon]|jgi:large subunit ribosomal protein L11|nr:50S ribosomal protein L11 [archaeon]MBT4647671.1 50S ribosomal protein L11 [archaeon]MBT6822214.1 50S ribosomal protein L11 [archaeon]MBT7391491.1 50S ribosomal protein L11 [archaeon]